MLPPKKQKAFLKAILEELKIDKNQVINLSNAIINFNKASEMLNKALINFKVSVKNKECRVDNPEVYYSRFLSPEVINKINKEVLMPEEGEKYLMDFRKDFNFWKFVSKTEKEFSKGFDPVKYEKLLELECSYYSNNSIEELSTEEFDIETLMSFLEEEFSIPKLDKILFEISSDPVNFHYSWYPSSYSC